jgi:hypothetical protein
MQGHILIIKLQGYEIWTCNIMLLMFPFVLLLCNKILEFCYLGYENQLDIQWILFSKISRSVKFEC